MSSITTELIALDTNQFVFGIRRSAQVPSCAILLFTRLPDLRIFIPVQVVVELNRNLAADEVDAVYDILDTAAEIAWDYSFPDQQIVDRYRLLGAKEGDATIAAHLESAGVQWLISENRHFLNEIRELPFAVISAEKALRLLDEG